MQNPSTALAKTARVAVISDETSANVREMLDYITACDDPAQMHNEVLPLIRETGIPGAFHEGIAQAACRQLKFMGAPIPIGQMRALLFPPALPRDAVEPGKLPKWAKPYAFVAQGNVFYNTDNGRSMDMIGFQSIYGEKMPVNNAGRRENAAERCLHFWGMPKVDDIGYRPDCGRIYEWDGAHYANSYSPASLPAVASQYTPEGVAGISAFQSLLWDMCGRRDDVFRNLLYWYAHNVQHPGVKIRWAPIIKGVHGDGKTLAVAVLRAAMGHRNVSTTGNATLTNSGGFTDWASRGAVNVIEEIMLTGKQRHQLYNAMKEFISNNIININPKGRQTYSARNCTNHIANTNHNDALPMEPTDRRWFVIFTPWASLIDMQAYCGLDGAGWKARTDAIDHAKEHCAGELRAWFMGIEIPAAFDINGSAMVTPEKMRMMASSKDDVESVVESIIAEGGEGITAKVVSTSHLSRLLALRAPGGGFDVPKTTALTYMLTRLGYSKLDKQIKWRGEPVRIWLKDGVELDNDQIRSQLDNSLPNLLPNLLPG